MRRLRVDGCSTLGLSGLGCPETSNWVAGGAGSGAVSHLPNFGPSEESGGGGIEGLLVAGFFHRGGR